MSSSKYLEEMKEIQESILDYLEDDNNTEKYDNLNTIFKKIQIFNPDKIKSLLYLILNIYNNYLLKQLGYVEYASGKNLKRLYVVRHYILLIMQKSILKTGNNQGKLYQFLISCLENI